jgi:hypothetical protein
MGKRIFMCPCCAQVRDLDDEDTPCSRCGYSNKMGKQERRVHKRAWRRKLGIPT